MRLNWFYVLIGLLFIGLLFISFRFFRGSRNSTVGVTYAKEYKITSEKSALVKSIRVVPGQQIKAGELLIELQSRDLEIELEKMTNHIAVLKSEQVEKSKLVQYQIELIRAQNSIEIEEIDSEIDQLKSQMSLNQDLTKEFTNIDIAIDEKRSPQLLKVNSLLEQKKRHDVARDIRIKDILLENDTEQSLLKNQISLLERELALLVSERESLTKVASSDGVVESVLIKSGEQVSAFSPMLTVNPKHPTTVIGYLMGKNETNLPIGKEVEVVSYEFRNGKVAGTVIGYGSVVQLPEILQKSTAVTAFGREVFIEIPIENLFATGEKVLIH
jgi:HlyD family secretion protein